MSYGLSQFDDEYDNTEAPAGFVTVPDGTYQARIDKFGLGKTQAGDPKMEMEFVIVSGECSGSRLFHSQLIRSKSLPYIKKDMETLGHAGIKISRLEDEAFRASVLDTVVEVQKKTRKDNADFYNVYLNSLVSKPTAPTATATDENTPPADSYDDGSIPF